MRLPSLFGILILTQACVFTRAPSLNLLEARADYDGMEDVERSLNAVDNPLLVPIRTEPRVADIWIHPHELPNGDYFRGAWIRTIVSRSGWRVDEERKPLIMRDTPKKEGPHGR